MGQLANNTNLALYVHACMMYSCMACIDKYAYGRIVSV